MSCNQTIIKLRMLNVL